MLGLSTVTKTVKTVTKKTTKTATPKARLINLAKSLDGAAKEIGLDAVPSPTPTEQETEALESLTATIIGMMGKHDVTLKKGTKASGKATTWSVSEPMITEGLGSVTGLLRGRKQSMENYLTVLLLWLLKGGTDFTQDR